MRRALAAIVIAFGLAIAAAHLAFTAATRPNDESGLRPWSQDYMEFIAWNGQLWSAWAVEERFVHVPHDASRRSRHVNRSLAYLDWDGEPWQAKIDGDSFLLAYRGNWEGEVERASGIRYRDWTGNAQLRTVAQLRR